MKEDKEFQIKEMSPGWIRFGLGIVGFAFIAHAIGGWGAFGVGLILLPFAYNNDLVRNYLKDFS